MEGSAPRSDEAFQRLLLEFSSAAAQTSSTPALVRLFCKATRDFFQVDGVYFWRALPSGEMVGAEADGWMADQFRGRSMKLDEPAVVTEAVQQRRTVSASHLESDSARSPMAEYFQAKALMAAPLVVSNEVLGAAVFLHRSDPQYFNDDRSAKATILTGQLGSLLEAGRLTEASQEEHRRAEILAQMAMAMHAGPESAGVVEAVAERLRVLLRTRLVCILLSEAGGMSIKAVGAESPQLADSVRARFDRKGLSFAADLASKALAAGAPITVTINPSSHSLGDLVPPGPLMAVPIRTSRAQGAVLVYPRGEGGFSPEEKSLVSAIASFGALAITNAELYITARGQAHELQQLLDISAELGHVGKLDEFMNAFALRARDFLGFGRACIGLLEDGKFRLRWKTVEGQSTEADSLMPEGVATRALLSKQPFWTDDPAKVTGARLDLLQKFNVRQLLFVPLLGSDREVLGMFGVLDRLDRAPITQEDVRRAQSLASQVAMALEATHNLHLSEQHRRRADSLMRLALELNTLLRLPDFAKGFTARAMEMTGAAGAALLVKQGAGLDVIALHSPAEEAGKGPWLARYFGPAVAEALALRPQPVVSSTAEELFGHKIAPVLGWGDCALVRLLSASGELVGVLCLADRGGPWGQEDEQLLQALAGHASIALENACLFSRMEQSNRHWVEIFDAIGDFIVVHDAAATVLRVNRSLADFIGVQPAALIGVNISALLAATKELPVGGCPFCTKAEQASDEHVHEVMERSFLVSTSRVHGASSEGLQTIHVLKDITERREVERRYRELFDNIQEGLFFSTPDGRFVEVNDALVRILGYDSREELLQVDVRREVHFSDEGQKAILEIMEEHGAVRNYEDVLRRRDGSMVHVLINAVAVRDHQGSTVQYRGVMLDISGLKSFQAELQRERDFSDKILNNTQSLILVADTAGLISYANRRWSDMGHEQKHLLGRPLQDLVAPSRREVFNDAFSAILTGQKVDNLDLQILRGDGSVGHFSVNLSPMRDEQGNVTSLVVVMTDVTDSAMLQSKLMHAEKMAAVGQLVSGVAHEVNNPLTAILGFADLMMENPELPEAARKDLRVILQEAQRTKQIVQNLLSFARQMPPQRKPVQLNPVLRRTVQLRSYDLQNHGVQVDEQLDPDLPPIMGDAHQLQQVFLNILNNAYDSVKEIGRPARIEIRTAKAGHCVEVLFRDNGQGISQPERIFDPFFTTKEVGKGTGLGLSICYGIVHEHGGEIVCQNNPGGEGATFIVRFPAASEQASIGAAAGVLQR